MRSRKNSIYRQLLPGLMLGILVIIGLLFLGDPKRVGDHLVSFHWPLFVLAMAFNFLNQTLRFLKRAINLRQSGIQNVNLLESMSLFLACLPLAVTSTRIGESFKGIWLFKKSGIPVERAISVFYVDQISDSLSVFVLMVIGTIAYPSLWPLFAILFLIFLGVIVYIKIPRTSSSFPAENMKIPILKGVLPQLRECIDANPALFTIPNMLITFLLGILSWAAEGAALFCILRGLGFPFSLPLIASAVLVFAFSATVSMATRLPGGLGVMEVAMALMLTLLLKFEPENAVAATILFRLATFWTTFLLGLLLWVVAGKSLGVQNQEGRIVEN